jgi:hypothetical protein
MIDYITVPITEGSKGMNVSKEILRTCSFLTTALLYQYPYYTLSDA